MNFSMSNLWDNIWNRDKAGNNWYYIDQAGNWGMKGSNLHIAQNHPILTPALLFVSKLYSQAEFTIENIKTKKQVDKHWLLKLLKKPNYYQTGSDFLESQMFMQIAQGKSVLYLKRTTGVEEVDSFYLLNSDLIVWPQDFSTPMIARNNVSKKIGNTKIKYDENGEDLSIAIKDLLFFYDLPSALNKNSFNTRSRLDGLNQTLVNTKDSLLAKNIILKTNGKELITGDKSGFPLLPDEKEEAEKIFNANYGLSSTKKRALISKASLTWKSMHIALRDLGLDESVKVDGNLIYTALHIPKDILSLEAKKTTYNNFKESMVSYIQNEIQSSLDATVAVLQSLITEPNLRIKGSYEHLPVMQFILMEKYDGLSKRAKALNDLLKTGIPKEEALELTSFPRDLELNELQPLQNENTNTNTQSSNVDGNNDNNND